MDTLTSINVEKQELRNGHTWAFGRRIGLDYKRGWFYINGFDPGPDRPKSTGPRGKDHRHYPVEIIRGYVTDANKQTAQRFIKEICEHSHRNPGSQTGRFRRDPKSGKVIDLHKAAH